MAYIALYEGEKRDAFEVPRGKDAKCPECGERMRVWPVSEDGKARHFKRKSKKRWRTTVDVSVQCGCGVTYIMNSQLGIVEDHWERSSG